MAKKKSTVPIAPVVVTELPVPKYIQNIFREAEVAQSMVQAYAKVNTELLYKAWDLFEEEYPQADGYYYAYGRDSGTMTRIKRPEPQLIQK